MTIKTAVLTSALAIGVALQPAAAQTVACCVGSTNNIATNAFYYPYTLVMWHNADGAVAIWKMPPLTEYSNGVLEDGLAACNGKARLTGTGRPPVERPAGLQA